MNPTVAILLSVVLCGCASAVSERVATNYTVVGAAAERRGDWDTARRAFARATLNSDQADLPPASRAIAHYEYGRSLGVTCFFDESERELNAAYELDKQAGRPLFLSLVELARLNLDRKKFSQSVAYFERAMPLLDGANAANKAPAAYSDILDEYAHALAGEGRSAEAKALADRATVLRDAALNKRSITDRTPYGKFCGKS
jgi:tetratricopeptide (TPR) repeat protein